MRVARNNYNLKFILGKNPTPMSGIDDLVIRLDDDTLLCIDPYGEISVLDAEGNEISMDGITIDDVLSIRSYTHKYR